MTRLAPLLTVALLGVFTARPISAQEQPVEAPAHISAVDGAALLERDGKSEAAPASMPVLPGDRVRTQAGRVEVLFNDRTTLHLDGNTIVDFQSAGVVRLLAGRVRLNIPGERAASYRVDAPTAWVQIANPGEYRVSILGGDRDAEVELAVIRGAAEIVNEDGRTMVSAGERAFARAGAAPSSAYVFNSAAWDDFDRWSETRRTARLGVSTEYLAGIRPVLRHHVRGVRVVAIHADLRERLVSAGQHGLASLLLRPLVRSSPLWLDVDWQRSVGLADASLRPLGILGGSLVLDSGRSLVSRVGFVGVCAELRQLVPARLEQRGGDPVHRLRLPRRPPFRSLARLDRRAASRLRPRLRECQRGQREPHRRAHARHVRRQELGTRDQRVRRVSLRQSGEPPLGSRDRSWHCGAAQRRDRRTSRTGRA